MITKIKQFLEVCLDKFRLAIMPICEFLLLLLIISNLYLITEASTKFEAGKYALSTVLALFFAGLIEISRRFKR